MRHPTSFSARRLNWPRMGNILEGEREREGGGPFSWEENEESLFCGELVALRKFVTDPSLARAPPPHMCFFFFFLLLLRLVSLHHSVKIFHSATHRGKDKRETRGEERERLLFPNVHNPHTQEGKRDTHFRDGHESTRDGLDWKLKVKAKKIYYIGTTQTKFYTYYIQRDLSFPQARNIGSP